MLHTWHVVSSKFSSRRTGCSLLGITFSYPSRAARTYTSTIIHTKNSRGSPDYEDHPEEIGRNVLGNIEVYATVRGNTWVPNPAYLGHTVSLGKNGFCTAGFGNNSKQRRKKKNDPRTEVRCQVSGKLWQWHITSQHTKSLTRKD